MASTAFQLFTYVYKSRTFILEMLAARGFDISQYIHYTENDLRTLLIAQQSNGFISKPEVGPLDILLEKKTSSTTTEKIYVKYRLDEKFRERENLTSQITDIFSSILSTNDCLIILNLTRIYINAKTANKSDSTSEEYVTRFMAKGFFVQMFGLENFLFNVSDHQFVPKHELASKEDIDLLMIQYNISNLKNLPSIKWLDPQAKYIGARPKSVLKITTFNSATGLAPIYRYCI
jgi:DNA-directed RNA polymerase subunit H